MTDIIIKNYGELKDIVLESLKEGTVVSIDLAGKEVQKDGA